MSRQDPTLPRREVVEALQEAPRLYVAGLASLPKGSGPRAHRGSGGRWAPPTPVDLHVHDLLAWAEWTALQFRGRFHLALGYSMPWGRLNDACPFCGMWSLVVHTDRGIVRCEFPGCQTPDGHRPVWCGRADWLELAGLLITRDLADDRDTEAPQPQPEEQQSA
jgi:hypothetical protein